MATTKAKPATKGRRTDYEAVERDYRTGSFTDQELGDKYGKSRQAITKQAKVKGWQKDLTAAVRQATNALMIADAAKEKVAEQVAQGSAATIDAVVETATRNAQVIMGHRKGLTRLANLKEKLLGQIEVAVGNLDTGKPEDRSMSRAALTDDLKKLADIDAQVRKGEREAYKLDDAPAAPEGEIASLVASLAKRSAFPIAA